MKWAGLKRAFRLSAFFAVFLMVSSVAMANQRPLYTDIGQLNYARFVADGKDFRAAAREFQRLIEDFPGSPLAVQAQLGMADVYYNAKRFANARDEYERVIQNFPGTPYANAAEVRLKEALDRIRESLPIVPIEEPEEPRTVKIEGLKAVQVMRFEGLTWSEVEEELKGLGKAGVDTVILRVFHNSGDRFYRSARPMEKRGVYFKTAHAPVVDDILGEVIRLAHSNGLKVFAWMTTRYADYGMEGSQELACKGYDIQEKKPARCKGLDLFNEDAVRRLEAIYSDLGEYDIDGVLFQDDLVLRHNEGFGPRMEALFKKDTGKDIDPEDLYIRVDGRKKVHYSKLFWEWASWKNKRLLEVAGRLGEAVKKKRPDARLAINLMYESVTNPPYALAWLSQDLKAAAKAGFDYFSIMAYHRQIGDELGKGADEVRGMIMRLADDASKVVGDSSRVLVKFQTIDWKTGVKLPQQEVAGLIRDVKGKGGFSMAVVPYRAGLPFEEMAAGAVQN